MTTVSFMVNGTAINNVQAKAWVTIEQRNGGGLLFQVKQVGGSMGSLRGVYFEVKDQELQNSFLVKASASSNKLMAQSDTQLYGTDMSEVQAGGNGAISAAVQNTHEVVNSYSFELTSRKRSLTLSDFSRIHLDDANMNVNDDQSDQWIYLELA